jgi:post-segregation antitoxin (ccd killing protein)
VGKVMVQVRIEAELLEAASRAGLGLEVELDRALRRRLGGSLPMPTDQCAQARRWADDNAEAITHNNARIGEEGLWSDGLRSF